MSTIHGSAGIVKVGSNAVAEIESFSIEESAEFADNTPMGTTARTSHETPMTSWSASVECMLDESDTTGQGAFVAGATVAAKFYVDGDASGKAERSGTLRVTGVSISQPKDGMVTVSFSGQGSGALAKAAVPVPV